MLYQDSWPAGTVVEYSTNNPNIEGSNTMPDNQACRIISRYNTVRLVTACFLSEKGKSDCSAKLLG
jgi:hypothetical protein